MQIFFTIKLIIATFLALIFKVCSILAAILKFAFKLLAIIFLSNPFINDKKIGIL